MRWLWSLGALIAGIALSHFAVRARLKRAETSDTAAGLKIGWPLLVPAGIYAILLLWTFPRFIDWLGEFHTHWVFDLGVISGNYFPPLATAGIAWLGWRDDRDGLPGWRKLMVLLAAWVLITVPIVLSWREATSLFSSGTPEMDAIIYARSRYDTLRLTFATLVGIGLTVALPLIDGLNGLFLGTVGVTFLHAWHMLAYQRGIAPFGGTTGGILVALSIGILLGLFRGNFPRGQIRLSEAAVLPLAYLTGLMASNTLRTTPPGIELPIFQTTSPDFSELRETFVRSAFIVIAPLVFPLIDLAVVSINRIRHARSAFAGGHDHLHHRLQQSGLTPVQTTLALLCAAAAPALSIATVLLLRDDGWRKRWNWIDWSAHSRHPLPGLNVYDTPVLIACAIGLLPLAYLFWRGYAKVDPYQSGAVDERGRP